MLVALCYRFHVDKDQPKLVQGRTRTSSQYAIDGGRHSLKQTRPPDKTAGTSGPNEETQLRSSPASLSSFAEPAPSSTGFVLVTTHKPVKA